MRFAGFLLSLCALTSIAIGSPALLDDQFELPRGFHIYRAAGPEITGGSYAITFDGEGRLLVGDGNGVRRLRDAGNDGTFDGFEILASGLGWRGPQGLLVYGDRLYAVGGDGIQVYEGYHSGGPLRHRGRIGKKFQTGGDHDAHTIFRGHDGYLYFMAGNGAGISKRTHITETNSPALAEREASVFRISPDGSKWECLASGGRNPPNLGMNYLGDLFSFDSDMEWHVGLPWYRPVRLNHWIIGGDEGWQEVGAFPPYYMDSLPGILDVGRGSPNWGVFYEHNQFPQRYDNAYFVCDYRWKRESNDQYVTTGRLVAFHLKPKGATWSAEIETVVRPRPAARDHSGKLISFALVDVAVAPDGSVYVSDHNQGIWRIFYGDESPSRRRSQKARTISPNPLDELLSLPQPGSEWSRLREEAIRASGGPHLETQLRALAVNSRKPVDQRLTAIRFLAAGFADLPEEFVYLLARDRAPEIRGQGAHLLGLRQHPESAELLTRLLSDMDPFVRRRAAEALTRYRAPETTDALLERLGDKSRIVAYTAMIALAHQPTELFFRKAAVKRDPDIRMRALVAAALRGELPPQGETAALLGGLLTHPLFPNERLDFLRVLGSFYAQVTNDHALNLRVNSYLAAGFPGSRHEIRWEQARLIAQYNATAAFPKLLQALEGETDPITQFHLAQSIAKLDRGWTAAEEGRLLGWFLRTQQGWFADFAGKGVEFPLFWTTVLSDFAAHHSDAVLGSIARVDFKSLFGTAVVDVMAHQQDGSQRLIRLYRSHSDLRIQSKVLSALASLRNSEIPFFCRTEYAGATNPELQGGLIKALAGQTLNAADASILFDGLRHRQIDVVRSSASAISRLKPELNEPRAHFIVDRLAENNELCKVLDSLLLTLTGEKSVSPEQKVTDSIRASRAQFWRAWYEKQFGRAMVAGNKVVEKTDTELMDFLLGNRSKGGVGAAGAQVYERLQCNTCHGGGVTPGREGQIFGPDLAGVTRRLSPKEFAESLVFPSRQVADRYKAYEVTLVDGTQTTGFITEQSDTIVAVADREQVRRLPRNQIRVITPQSVSLMPDHLLNALSWEQIRDLVAFLDEGPRPSAAR